MFDEIAEHERRDAREGEGEGQQQRGPGQPERLQPFDPVDRRTRSRIAIAPAMTLARMPIQNGPRRRTS